MLRAFAFLAVLLLPSLAFAQANDVSGTPPLSGIAIGAGYSAANGQLFMATSSSLQSIKIPFSYSIDFQGTFSAAAQLISTDNAAFTAGLILEYNSSLAFDFYHLQTFLHPGYGFTGCSNNSTMCWRNTAITDGLRHNLCVVWTATQGYFYIDGIVRDQTSSIGSGVTISNTPWMLGSNLPANDTLWDFRVYNHALTADECGQINALNQAGLIPSTSGTTLAQGLVVSLPLNNCVVSGALYICPDGSGNGNNATNDATPPTVVVTEPSAGTVSDSVTMQATCTDPSGLACVSVCYLVDGVLVSSSCPTTVPFTFSWNSATSIDGSHTITAAGTNVASYVGTSAGIAVTTSNSVFAKTVQVNSATGLDTNPCTVASPCLTMAHIQSAIIFHGGDTLEIVGSFTDTATFSICGPAVSGCTQNFYPSASTFTVTTTGGGCNPFTLATTGCGVLTVSGAHDAMDVNNAPNITITNVVLVGNSSASSGNVGLSVTSSLPSFATMSGVTVTNTWTRDFANNMQFTGSSTSTITGYVVSDNVSSDTLHSNPGSLSCIRFNAGTQGTIEGNLAFQCNGQVGNNGNGIAVFNYPSPSGISSPTLFQYNVVHDFGYSFTNNTGGPVGCYVSNANLVTVQFNECYNGFPNTAFPYDSIIDYDCFDIDNGATNVTLQYNYGHDCPVQAAFNFIMGAFPGGQQSWTSNVARYNIGENSNTCLSVGGSNGQKNIVAYIYNNTCSSNTNRTSSGFDLPICWTGGGNLTPPFMLANNICIYTGTTQADWENLLTPNPPTILNNDYYSAGSITPTWRWNEIFFPTQRYSTLAAYQSASGLDANSLNVNPMLSGTPGTGGTCWAGGTSAPTGPQPCPTTYELLTGSPMIGVGLDLTQAPYSQNVGSVDYYGNSIPNGSGYNMGADGAHH